MEGSSPVAMLALNQKGQVSYTLLFAFNMIALQNFKQSPGRSHGQDERAGEGWILYPFL